MAYSNYRKKPDPEIGKRVRDAIKAAGLKQVEVAEELGMVNANSLSLIVRGERGLTKTNAEKIGQLCGVRPGWLLGIDEHRTDEEAEAALIKERIAKDNALALQKNHKISRYLAALNLLKEAKFKVDLITDSGPVEYDGDSLVFYELFRHPTGEVFIIETPDGIKKTVGFEELFSLVKSLDRYVVSAVSQFAGFAFVHMKEEGGYTNG